MAPIVIYDANILYPNLLRNLAIRIAMKGLVRARWTDQILDEVFRSLKKNRPDVPEAKLLRTRMLISQAVPESLVENYQFLIDQIMLPDADDRHVVAAAIKCSAQAIVTWNLRDFPRSELERWGIVPLNPDKFFVELLNTETENFMLVLAELAESLRAPSLSVKEILKQMEKLGLVDCATRIEELGR